MTRGLRDALGALGVRSALLIVLLYQSCVRPFLMGACRYYPSCSEYAMEALRRHGVRRGLLLAGSRLLRCHPLTRGGCDPVP